MSVLVRNWNELFTIPPTNKYKIVRDEDDKIGCCAWIVPVEETKETFDNYFDYHIYLSTHAFYGKHYKESTKILQKSGFNVEIDNWDQET